ETRVEAVDVSGKHGEGLRQIEAQAKPAAVRVANVNAAPNALGRRSAGRRAIQKRFVEKRAGSVQRNSGNSNAIGDGFEFGRDGRGEQRKIRAANFGGVIGAHGEKRSITGRGKIGCGIAGRRNGEGVWRCGDPLGHWPAGRGAESKVDSVSRGIRLEQWSAD